MIHIQSRQLRALALACAALVSAGAADAQGHGRGFGGGHYSGYHGGGYHGGYYHGGGHGWGWGGLGLGIGLGVGFGLANYYGSPWYDPGYVVVDPGVTVVQAQPVPAPVTSSYEAQPIIYPRNGQSAAQMDADSNACSEWAGKQANATSDAGVFRRGIAACMDARGYTVR